MIVAEYYPFVREFIVDSAGEVDKVIMNLADYHRLIEHIEDEGLYQAILAVKDERSLNLEEALELLDQE